MTEWNKEKEKKVLTRYRFTLTVKVIRVILACLFLFWVYMMIVSISFSALHMEKKHVFNSKLAMDWTIPNLHEEFGSFVNSEITPLWTQKVSYPVFRKVGKEYKVVGEMNMSKTIFDTFSQKNVQYDEVQQGNHYPFYLPEHPKTGGKLGVEDDPGVWNKLEKVHEGTVAELSFSTSTFMTAEELLNLIEPYDLDILWAPLYAGEFKEFEPSSYGGGGGTISVGGIFGLTGGREISDDYKSEMKVDVLTEKHLEQSKELMLTNMENLLEEESKTYYEEFLGLDRLEERYEFLKENGFTVYGAVVTGPVKELLKLREVKEIRGVSLGEMDYWNWE